MKENEDNTNGKIDCSHEFKRINIVKMTKAIILQDNLLCSAIPVKIPMPFSRIK